MHRMSEEQKSINDRRHRPEQAKHNWQTPEHILELAREVMGGITFDPFTSIDNPTRATYFCSPEAGEDGLAVGWLTVNGKVWLNPPYGRFLSAFAEKFERASLYRFGFAAGSAQMIALVPARTEVRWWQRMYHASDAVCLWGSRTLGSRISFIDPETKKPVKGNDSASSFFYVGPNVHQFCKVFSPHGLMVKGGV